MVASVSNPFEAGLLIPPPDGVTYNIRISMVSNPFEAGLLIPLFGPTGGPSLQSRAWFQTPLKRGC